MVIYFFAKSKPSKLLTLFFTKFSKVIEVISFLKYFLIITYIKDKKPNRKFYIKLLIFIDFLNLVAMIIKFSLTPSHVF